VGFASEAFTHVSGAVGRTRVVRTLTLLRESEGGLPMEEIYAEELARKVLQFHPIGVLQGDRLCHPS
jgi:hypothetical protein